jgi:hypothetical protein
LRDIRRDRRAVLYCSIVLNRWICFNLGALSLACSSDLPLSGAAPELPALVCVAPASQVVADTLAGTTELTLSGRVEAVGSGPQETPSTVGCPFTSDMVVGYLPANPEELAQVRWVQIRSTDDPAALSQFAVKVPGFSFEGLDGARVSLSLHYDSTRIYGGVSAQRFELRRDDGSLLFWFAEGERLDELVGADEVDRELGSVAGRHRDDCIPEWREHELLASVANESTSVPPRERARVGGLVVTNASLSVQTRGSICADASASWARAAAWPVELATDP